MRVNFAGTHYVSFHGRLIIRSIKLFLLFVCHELVDVHAALRMPKHQIVKERSDTEREPDDNCFLPNGKELTTTTIFWYNEMGRSLNIIRVDSKSL